MSNRITDVIFDLDGTLIDSAPSILSCFAAVLRESSIDSVIPLTEALIGPPLRETMSRISGVNDEARLVVMTERFKQFYDVSGYRDTKVFPGVEPMLRELSRAGLRLHIATNKRLRPARLILDYLGWTGLFDAVYSSDYRSPSFKSKSEMIAVLTDLEGISSDHAVYVGDRSEDWHAAIDNALGFLAATWGYRDEDLITANQEIFLVEFPAQLVQILTKSS